MAAGWSFSGRTGVVGAEAYGSLGPAHGAPSKGAPAAFLQQSGPISEWKSDVVGNANLSRGTKNLDFYVSYLNY